MAAERGAVGDRDSPPVSPSFLLDASDIIQQCRDSDASDLSPPPPIIDLEAELSRLLLDHHLSSSSSESEESDCSPPHGPLGVRAGQPEKQAAPVEIESMRLEDENMEDQLAEGGAAVPSHVIKPTSTPTSTPTVPSGSINPNHRVLPPLSGTTMARETLPNLAIRRLQSNESLQSSLGPQDGSPRSSSSQLSDECPPKPLAEELEEVDRKDTLQREAETGLVDSDGSSELYSSSEEESEEGSEGFSEGEAEGGSEESSEEDESEGEERESDGGLSDDIDFELREEDSSPQRELNELDSKILSLLLVTGNQSRSATVRSETSGIETHRSVQQEPSSEPHTTIDQISRSSGGLNPQQHCLVQNLCDAPNSQERRQSAAKNKTLEHKPSSEGCPVQVKRFTPPKGPPTTPAQADGTSQRSVESETRPSNREVKRELFNRESLTCAVSKMVVSTATKSAPSLLCASRPDTLPGNTGLRPSLLGSSASTSSSVVLNSPRPPLKGILKKRSRFGSTTSTNTDLTTVTPLGSDSSSNTNSQDDTFEKRDTVSQDTPLSVSPLPSDPVETRGHSVEAVFARQPVLGWLSDTCSSSDDGCDLDRTLTETPQLKQEVPCGHVTPSNGDETSDGGSPPHVIGEQDLKKFKKSLDPSISKQLISSQISAHHPLLHSEQQSPMQTASKCSPPLPHTTSEERGPEESNSSPETPPQAAPVMHSQDLVDRVCISDKMYV